MIFARVIRLVLTAATRLPRHVAFRPPADLVTAGGWANSSSPRDFRGASRVAAKLPWAEATRFTVEAPTCSWQPSPTHRPGTLPSDQPPDEAANPRTNRRK